MVAVRRGAGRASEQPDRDGLATIFPSWFLGVSSYSIQFLRYTCATKSAHDALCSGRPSYCFHAELSDLWVKPRCIGGGSYLFLSIKWCSLLQSPSPILSHLLGYRPYRICKTNYYAVECLYCDGKPSTSEMI